MELGKKTFKFSVMRQPQPESNHGEYRVRQRA
jgi:hypothetical protein